MSDDISKRGPQDGQRINMDQDYEVRYWSERLGVSKEELQRVITAAGPMVADVERELSKSRT